MPCFKPLNAWQNEDTSITFGDNVKGGNPIQVPCGQCIGCRLTRSAEWATRIVHEASQHDENCFITLTYNDENIPHNGSLKVQDYQLFMKRLRSFIETHTWNGREYIQNPTIKVWSKRKKIYENKPIKCYNKVRYYHCGEYGDKNNRPHYHAVLFGFNLRDWVYLFDSDAGYPIYMSPTLEKIWSKGFVTIGEVTFESAAYVARYCVKKINGDKKDEINPKTGLKHYERIDYIFGEVHEVLPEYATMSRRPGIGHNWISTYTNDCYPKDYTHVQGRRVKIPKYYDKYLEGIDKELYDDIKLGRVISAYENQEETTPLRLKAREKVKEAQNNQLKRSL